MVNARYTRLMPHTRQQDILLRRIAGFDLTNSLAICPAVALAQAQALTKIHSLTPAFLMPEATNQMIIHYSTCLQKSIANGRTHESHTFFLQGFADFIR